jgi:hypothetical protein
VYFLGPCPALDLFFSFQSVVNILVMLEPDEAMALIVCREAGDYRRPMFVSPTRDTVGYTAVQHPGSTGDYIDVVVMVALAHLHFRCRSG